MTEYQYHAAAGIFPLLSGDEFESLKADIQTNGLCEPIVLFEGKILDGRNRYNACAALGIEPKFVTYEGTDPLSYVISLNLHRRHLTETQRAVVAARLANMERGGDGSNQHGSKSANLPISAISQPAAAQMLNVSERTLRTVKAIERDAPDMLPKLESGEMTANQAIREVKRAKVIENLESVDAIEVKAASGKYDVIVIDPPWQMQKIERDVAPLQVEFDYPTMTIDEIKSLEIPAADDCHLFLWTTQKYLPTAFDILNAWGAFYVCTFVWHKPGGFQPFNLPQYNCEFVLYAHIGSPLFIDQKDFMTCFNAQRTGHSQKPDEFYMTIKRVTAGRRLDMFNRRKIDGFDTWGKEAG